MRERKRQRHRERERDGLSRATVGEKAVTGVGVGGGRDTEMIN